MSQREGDVLRCSFCGKSQHEVKKLIAGPTVYICNECVEVCLDIIAEDRVHEAKVRHQDLPKPQEIKGHLDDFVIGQESAKKKLSVAVYNHYKRIEYKQAKTRNGIELAKANILLIGPTGTGKTLLAQTLARQLEVPFTIVDATTLTEAGYVGEDVENVLLKLIQAADYDVKRAEQGIIYIDEIDKIGKTSQNVSITRDVGGEGVQQSLLKLLEGTVANVPPHGGRKHPEEKYISIDTGQILFICGGAFNGITDIIAKRMNQNAIGFAQDDADEVMEAKHLLEEITDEDLVHYGLIPELVGRVPVLAPLMPLGTEQLVRILTGPRNALVRQYQKYFDLEGARLEFTDEALVEIAQKATAKGTGARGLRTVMELLMLDPLYDLPTRAKGYTYVVTAEVARGEHSLFEERKQRKGA